MSNAKGSDPVQERYAETLQQIKEAVKMATSAKERAVNVLDELFHDLYNVPLQSVSVSAVTELVTAKFRVHGFSAFTTSNHPLEESDQLVGYTIGGMRLPGSKSTPTQFNVAVRLVFGEELSIHVWRAFEPIVKN